MTALVPGSWKPWKVRLGTMPAGGTSPSREPAGKIASAAAAGAGGSISTTDVVTIAKPRHAIASPALRRHRRELVMAARSILLIRALGRGAVPYKLQAGARVTRRIVRLIRPPLASKVDVCG